MKLFLPLIGGVLFLCSCTPEKLSESEQIAASKETLLSSEKSASGRTLYEANCAGCHDASVGGAPKPGDKRVWKERLATGMETMVKKSIEGYEGTAGVMPPKGGNASLSDEEVRNAVAYMASTVK
jgi:cytochrome c5